MNQVPPLSILLIIIYYVINFIQPTFTQLHPLIDTSKGDKLSYLYNFLNRNGHQEMCKLLRTSNLDNYLSSFEYTLISPTDEAFALISPTIRQRLQNDTEYQLNFIKNHLINGRLFFSSISSGQQILVNAVASNSRIHIAAYPTGYVINGAQLLAADRQIDSTPNLAQFVDRPIYLEASMNLGDYLSQNYRQLQRFIEISGLNDLLLQDDKERTIFAPSDDAFRALPWPVIEEMYNNNTFLTSVLQNHIVNGIHYSFGLQSRHQSSAATLRSQNGEKLDFKTKKLQGRNVVFVNDIPIVNGDQLVKNGLVHEISKLILPKQLIDKNCINCLEMTINNTYSQTAASIPVNANLINKEILIDSDFHRNYPNSVANNQSTIKSTIIPESMKRKYINLLNREYRPIASTQSNQVGRSNESTMFRPQVFYDKSDLNYFTTSSPKIPVSYHTNHNYYKSNLLNNRTRTGAAKSKNNNNNNFYSTDNNSLAFPANSLPSYSPLPSPPRNSGKINNLTTLESPFLTIFDPFTSYRNQTAPFANPISRFHSTTVNISQSLPSMTHYLTHVYHGDHNQQLQSSPGDLPFIYNMERMGIPNMPGHDLQSATTFKPFPNTKSVLYQVVPTMSSLLDKTLHYPTKNQQHSNSKAASSKYYNDLTTPTPMYFDPTRRPKSPGYLNRIRRVNELNNQHNLQTGYQVMDSNVVQKVDDTKTSSNNNQQVVVPARLDLNQFATTENQFGRNRFNGYTVKNRSPMVTLSTIDSNHNRTASSRQGRIRNFDRTNNSTPYITLLDVLRNPYLMINNEPIEFNLFESLLNQTNLANLLRNGRGQLTLVLPTDIAFRKLKDYELEYLKLKIPNIDSNLYSSAMRKKRQLYVPKQEEIRLQIIKNLILNHISPNFVNPDSIVNQVNSRSYSNHNLQFSRRSNKLYVNNIPVLATTIVSNGVAYVVDGLVMNNNTLFETSNQLKLNDTVSRRKMISSVDSVLNPSLIKLDTKILNRSQSVIEIIENISDLSFFTGLVKKSNYSTQLASSRGIYTILAPENKAFSILSHRVIDLLKSSPSFINKFVANHIINANFSIDNLVVSPIVLNLNRIPIRVESSKGMILLNDTAMMKRTNIATSTGFLHILTHALVPSAEPYESRSSSNVMMLNRKPIFIEPTIQHQLIEIAKSRSSTKFLTFFIQNNYIDMFKNTRKNFTLILPSDIAYYSLPESVINKMENNTSKLKILLNYHLLNQLVDPFELHTIDQVSSSTGLPLHYANVTALNNEQKTINAFNFVNSDSRSIQSISYSMLSNETALLHPPTDHLNNIRKLIDQLRMHPESNQLTISGATIQEIRLIEVENQYSERGEKNYVEILFVDRVLYTPKGTIYELIKSSPMLTILNQLIEATNLRDELDWILIDHSKHKHQFDTSTTTKINGYTFFAPSDTAFRERLGLDVVEQLKKNLETAKVFLLRHLIKRPLFTSSISVNGSLIENSTGEHLNLQKSGDVVAIEGVIVEIADITTTNGVVHVIENVL